MIDNREIINEAFFKKKESYSDRLRKLLPDYEPMDKRIVGNPGYTVSNADEVKKRLVSSFGAIVGNNTIKTMASKAIKTFPIIISDNVDPETAVLIKKLTEEQYAQYIELLISNQIVDASEFAAGGDSTVAIQALDRISGADFSKRQGLGTKTASGEISLDDIAKNNLLYNLIRQESVQSFNDKFLDTLLEDAVFIPEKDSSILIDYIANNYESITEEYLKEEPTEIDVERPTEIDAGTPVPADRALNNIAKLSRSGLFYQDQSIRNPKTGASYTPLMVDENSLNQAVGLRIGQILDKNPAIRDRFEKATFLLYANKITGAEYIAYLTQRLGIPLSQKTRIELITKYRADKLDYGRLPFEASKKLKSVNPDKNGDMKKYWDEMNEYSEKLGLFTNEDREKIASFKPLNNTPLVKEIRSLTGKDLVKATAIGGIGAGAGAGVAALVTAIPMWAALVVPALVGSGAYIIAKAIKKSKDSKKSTAANSIYGWERVESLIEVMDMQRKDVQAAYERATGKKDAAPEFLLSSADLDAAIKKATSSINSMNEEEYFEAVSSNIPLVSMNFSKEIISEGQKILDETVKDILSNETESKELQAEIFQESVISTTFPITVKKNYEFDPKKPADITVVPEFSLRNKKAYGSVEYDTKQIKDRRYNQPLIMKVNFRERFSDGTFSDNEMTAVIGILGVVTRVPSDEMEQVLKANAEGSTLKGIFKSDGGKIASIADLFPLAKKSTNLKNMSSSETWENLEKISKLAAINKLVGRQNNNISNAHIIFSQKEIDDVRNQEGIDYLKDKKLLANLMKRYSAFSIMIANDIGERMYIYDDIDSSASIQVVPYSALRSKDSTDQLTSALTRISDRR